LPYLRAHAQHTLLHEAKGLKDKGA